MASGSLSPQDAAEYSKGAPAITVAGLGTGDADQLTLGIWRRLQEASAVYVRTAKHPMMDMLRENGLDIQSFDRFYEEADSFPEVYDRIADELIRGAKAEPGSGVLYAVPGHPMVAERTVQLLRERCPQEGVELLILGGESFLDMAFTRLGFDPIEGFQLLDSAGLQPHLLQPQLHTLIGQVYDDFTASDVKLTLMERYPEDHPVVIGHALGVPGEERIVTVPLFELDREQQYGNLSLVYIPASSDERLRNRSFDRCMRSSPSCEAPRAVRGTASRPICPSARTSSRSCTRLWRPLTEMIPMACARSSAT